MYTVRDYVKAIMVKPGDYYFNREFIDLVSDGVKRGIVTLDELKMISMEADERISRGEQRWRYRWQVFRDVLKPKIYRRLESPDKEPPPTKEESARILKELDNQPFRRSDGPGPRIPEKPQCRPSYDFNRLDEHVLNRFKKKAYSFFRELGRMAELRIRGKLSVEKGNYNLIVAVLLRTRQCCLVIINVIDSILSEIEPARIQEPVEDITNDDPN